MSNATINRHKYIVADEDGILYPLSRELNPSQMTTFVSAQSYAEHLSQCYPNKTYEVWGLRQIISFKTEQITSRKIYATRRDVNEGD